MLSRLPPPLSGDELGEGFFYAEAFDSADCLHRLEAFASFYGPDFYNLARNQDTITLDEESWRVAETLRFGNDELVPIRTGELINWKVRSS